MIKFVAKVFTVLFLLLVMSCSTFTLTKPELVEQLKAGQAYHETFVPLLFSRYNHNGIKKILCKNSDGELVYLFPDHNTQFEITSKSGEVFKAYFDTVFINGDKVVGLRSRIIGGEREILLEDIAKVEIYAEMAKTEKYIEPSS